MFADAEWPAAAALELCVVCSSEGYVYGTS